MRKLFVAIALISLAAVPVAYAGTLDSGASRVGLRLQECTGDEGDNLHPSGKDRSCEPGGSGDQGNAQSDPDDDGRGPDRSNGGPDQPGGAGGFDKDDQDANNGCGNDDDFEDDNEGLCMQREPYSGRRPHVGKKIDDAVATVPGDASSGPRLWQLAAVLVVMLSTGAVLRRKRAARSIDA